MTGFFTKKPNEPEEKKFRLAAYFIIAIFSLIPIVNTYGYLTIGGDTIIPLNPEFSFHFNFEWIDIANGLFVTTDVSPLLSFFLVLKKIGLSLYQAGFLFQFAIFFLSGAGIYKIYNLFNEKTPFFGIVPAIFFIYSPHRYDHMIYFHTTAVVIWLLYFLLRAIKNKHISTTDILALGVLPAFLGNLPNPKYHFLTFLMFAFTVFLSFAVKYLKKEDIKKNLLPLFLIILLNAHIILRLGFFAYSYATDVTPLVKTIQAEKASYHALDYGAALLSLMIRLWHTPSMNKEDVAIMETPLFALSYTLIPLVIFILFPLFFFHFSKKYRRFYLIFFGNALLFVFLSKSANPPFGFLYDLMLNSAKVFAFMRTSAGLVIYAGIFYALIIGFVFQYLFLSTKGRLRITLLIFTIATLLISGFHIWSGKYFRNTINLNHYADKDKHGKRIPQDYFDSAQVISRIPLDTKIDIYPGAEGYQSNTWGYFGFIIYPWIYDKPMIGFNKYTYDGRVNSMTNALYLVHDKTLIDENQLKKGIEAQIARPIFSSNTIDVYEKKEAFFVPHIYTPNTVDYSNRMPLDKMITGWRELAAIYRAGMAPHILGKLDSKISVRPTIVYKKINPTKYRVRMYGASGIFPLIFSENYHHRWKLYLSKSAAQEHIGSEFVSKNFYQTIQNNNLDNGHFWETWFLKQIGQNVHLPVNTFANSWIIDIKKICTDYRNSCIVNPDGTYTAEVIIEFFPQQIAYFGSLISIVTFLYVCSTALRKKYHS